MSETLMNAVKAIDFSAIVEIAILYFVIYAILKAAKGSRFGQALMGVGVLAAAMIAFSYLFHFEVLSRIIQALLIYMAISSVVIFQPEIRRILAQVGAFGFLERRKHSPDGVATAQYIVETLTKLAEKRIGALIAFERGISLRSYESTGVQLNADFSRELVESVFTPPLPLHDGGMTMRGGRISSAHCVFPVSNNPGLVSIGMRHRAAVGLSEETDALVIVVSEETGSVAVAHNGRLLRYFNDQIPQSLPRWVAKAMSEDRRQSKIFSKLYSRLMNSRFMKGLRK